jgi:hypothetical protein
MVFQYRVLRIFGSTRDEIIEGWRKLQNEELDNLYFSPNIIILITSRRMRWAGHVIHMGGEEECIWGIGQKAKRNETNMKTRHRW